MRVAAHQPHSFPWLGYMHKIANCDLFVVMDDLQFETQNFQNRNRVKLNNGTAWLTVPLVRSPQSDRICDKVIANTTHPKEDWRRKIWVTLKTHYGKAPHFHRYAPELEQTFRREWTKLLDFDLHMMRLFAGWLGIETKIVMASSLELQGQKTARIVHMCKRVGGTSYYSGKGGSTDYLDLSAFSDARISLEWQQFRHPFYPQRYPALGFVKNLAALDMLFNCGPESRRILLRGE